MSEKIDITRTALINNFVRLWAPRQDDIQEKMKSDLSALLDVYKSDGNDPKYLNIPNICFSLTNPDDNREPEFRKQRIERGFDSSETWSLKSTIAQFILPRLKVFRTIINETIEDSDGFYKEVDMSIRAFEIFFKDCDGETVTDAEWKEYEKGMKAFIKVYPRLWW